MGEEMKEGTYKISIGKQGLRYFAPYYPPYPLKASEYTPFFEWQLHKTGNNEFFIEMDSNGLGAYIDRRDQIWVATPSTPRVPFSIESAGNGTWRVHLGGHNSVWTIDSSDDGLIILSPWVGGDNQKFTFEYVGPLPGHEDNPEEPKKPEEPEEPKKPEEWA